MAGGIPDRVGQFIAENITSVEGLETLLLLRSEPDRYWSAEALGAELRSVPESVALRLHDLREAGLAHPDDAGEAFRFAAASADVVDALADCYRRRRVAVIAAIFAEPGDDPVQDFADAFRLRGEGH